MQNLQTNEALLRNFQVEELEERLENKWGSGGGGTTLTSCLVTQEVNICKGGATTPLTYVYVNGNCSPTVSIYVCKL